MALVKIANIGWESNWFVFLFVFLSTINYLLTAPFSVHNVYKGGSVQDGFQYSVFIACHVN